MPAVFTTTPTYTLRRAVPALVGAAIVLAACGGGDHSTDRADSGSEVVDTVVDTSLGFYDGCRWATAPTDVPALIVGYDGTMAFEQARDLACSDTTPEPAVAARAAAALVG